MLKRFSIVPILTIMILLAFAGAAYANFGPHGGYADDTDACAACHRAHTSFSTIGFTDRLGTPHPSALLVGSAQTMTEFCEACHGDLAPGASTNVASGVFDAGPSGSTTQTTVSGPGNLKLDGTMDDTTVTVGYQTNSAFNAPLNGGGFNRMPDPYVWETSATSVYKATTSAHKMDVSGPLWGAGQAVADYPMLTCTDCHDPHGSSNYRLLKADVNGHNVGGYDSTGEGPTAFVFSNEEGYPAAATGGWLKHAAGAAQMASYRPNYTDTTGTPILHQDSTGAKSMSQWCAACHENYATSNGNTTANGGLSGTYDYTPYLPGAVGARVFHRHPVDITLAAGYGAGRALQEQVVSGLKGTSNENWIPLETVANTAAPFYQNYIGCLTCHRAHGSSSDETAATTHDGIANGGWAASHLASVGASGTLMPVRDGVPGVDPAKGTSNLLRTDNRGICERCHNK
jgi:hypothetical protein